MIGRSCRGRLLITNGVSINRLEFLKKSIRDPVRYTGAGRGTLTFRGAQGSTLKTDPAMLPIALLLRSQNIGKKSYGPRSIHCHTGVQTHLPDYDGNP